MTPEQSLDLFHWCPSLADLFQRQRWNIEIPDFFQPCIERLHALCVFALEPLVDPRPSVQLPNVAVTSEDGTGSHL